MVIDFSGWQKETLVDINSVISPIQSCGCAPVPEQIWQEVHAHYGGNPLALKIAAINYRRRNDWGW